MTYDHAVHLVEIMTFKLDQDVEHLNLFQSDKILNYYLTTTHVDIKETQTIHLPNLSLFINVVGCEFGNNPPSIP